VANYSWADRLQRGAVIPWGSQGFSTWWSLLVMFTSPP
jgi:hypothetical protein